MLHVVHPALVRAWRDHTTVQIGLDPRRALVLGGMSDVEATLLRSIDDGSDPAMLRSLAAEVGGDPSVADRLVDVLETAGVLIDGSSPVVRPTARVDASTPDCASLGLLTESRDGGARALGARGDTWVDVRHAGRVGASVARLLRAAGVGRVTISDDESVSPQDVSPAGFSAHHVGQVRSVALADELDNLADSTDDRQAPNVTVLAPPGALPPNEVEPLLRAGATHIAAQVMEVTGVVGPLVVPGASSCLRCQHLHRTDRDHAWPRVLAQAVHSPPSVAACDITIATAIAALTAQQVLAHLDGFTPATVNGTVEIGLPDGLPRRRSWPPHPACGCTWPD